MKARAVLLAGVCAIALAACGKKDAATEETAVAPAEESAPPDGATLAAENHAKAVAFLADNAAKPDIKTTDSGLQYEVLSEGPTGGYAPKATDIVDVHYVGTLLDGVEFDSSRARGAAARFPLNQVIPGWTEGVQLMTEGDRYRFFIPPELAYGESGTPGGPI
ncbi:MAG: FKBP-type peptidyl-prolyl cis-trans isomerase, partial [Amphiplicatus sp.]